MDIEQLRDYCLSKPNVTEDTPFGPDTLVFKVYSKLFCLCNIEDFRSANMKCEPEKAIELREAYQSIKPGFYMNKKHWNTVTINDDVDDNLFLQLVDHSYDLVLKSVPTKIKNSN